MSDRKSANLSVLRTELSLPKKSTKPKSILKESKRAQQSLYPVFYEGENVTPKPLNPLIYREGRERQISILNIADVPTATGSSKTRSSIFGSFSETSSKLHTDTLLNLGSMVGYASTQQLDINILEPLLEKDFDTLSTVETIIDIKPPPIIPMPPRISLILVETPTHFIFELPSSTAEKGTKEGDDAENDNKEYEFLTVGRGRNRKTVHAEVQTIPVLLKSRDTAAIKRKTKSDYAYASGWDMYDTYSNSPDMEVISIDPKKSSMISIDSFQVPSEDKQMMKLVKTSAFLNALCVVERLLANNNFNEQQKRFRGLSEPDPFRENIEYTYRLNLLWTFSNEKTQGRCVSSICWNTTNEDIVAVGYGKFNYSERTTGMVMIWNIKNPVQPERTYDFPEPVTAVDFSKQHPNLLAVGFYDGTIKVLEVSEHGVKYLGVTSREDSPLFEPIWKLTWYTDQDYYKGTEFLMAASQDGRLSRFTLEQSAYMPYFHLMRVSRAEGKLKGLIATRKCVVPGIPIARHPAALVMTEHPVDPNIYYIGTSEGVVHKCSKNYYHQHLDLFLAHEGPMYQLKFSPFCNKIFLTCGDDWIVRIWAEGISEPLLELQKTMQTVQSADWSPAHSTIIASVSGPDIFLWDLQRKAYAPQSITRSPGKSRCTIVEFTKNGRCLLVADIEGNVQIFSLEDMPFSPFFQGDLLTQAIKRELVIKPDLLKKVDKMESLSFKQEKFKRHFH